MLDGGGIIAARACCCQALPGSGKTTLGARFLEAGCERGERGMLFAFEESPAQIARNMRSVGIDVRALGGCRDVADRLGASGGVRVGDASSEDVPGGRGVRAGERRDRPVVGLNGEEFQLKAMLSRLIDHFKARADHGGDDDADPGGVRGSRGAGDLERDRHVGRCQQPGDRRGAQPGDRRPEVPGDGPLKPGQGVPDHQPGSVDP